MAYVFRFIWRTQCKYASGVGERVAKIPSLEYFCISLKCVFKFPQSFLNSFLRSCVLQKLNARLAVEWYAVSRPGLALSKSSMLRKTSQLFVLGKG